MAQWATPGHSSAELTEAAGFAIGCSGTWPTRSPGCGRWRGSVSGRVPAVRAGDYGGMAWFPPDEDLDRWLHVFAGPVRRHGGEPQAGRRLVSGAHAAGLDTLAPSATAWCFATPSERQWWGRAWAGRVTTTSFADQAVAYGLATREQLEDIATAWLRWADADDGWFGMLQGEPLVRV